MEDRQKRSQPLSWTVKDPEFTRAGSAGKSGTQDTKYNLCSGTMRGTFWQSRKCGDKPDPWMKESCLLSPEPLAPSTVPLT